MMKSVDCRETFMISRDLLYGPPPGHPAGVCEDQETPFTQDAWSRFKKV